MGVLLIMGTGVQAQCPNTAAAITQQGTDCGANVNYAVTNDVGFSSVEWFLDNGLLTTQQSGTIYLDPGSYVFRVITIDANNCTNVYEEVVVVGSNFSVTIVDGDGGIACNGNLLLNSIVTGGSGNFAYQWSPANMMDSPTASATTMGVGSGTTEVTLTVTDLTLGCSFSASTTVYPNLPITETLELCGTGDVAELTLDPGSMVYAWTAIDSEGNPIDMSGVTGNSFTATEPGTYQVMTYYSGCNQVVHEFEVEECTNECSGSITYVQDCNTVHFSVEGTPDIISYNWTIFNGLPALTDPSPSVLYPAPGVWQVWLTVEHSNGCVSNLYSDVTIYFDLEVALPEDTIACNGNLFISPTVSGGSGDYSYLWTPAFAVNDPTAQGVQIQQSFPLWVSVTVTDNQTGCSASDSVFVSPNIPSTAVVALCNMNTPLAVEPGSETYSWSGVSFAGIPLVFGEGFEHVFHPWWPGTYTVETAYPGCNTVTHTFEVTSCDAPCPHDTTYTLSTENCSTTVCFDLGPGFSQYGHLDNIGISGSHQAYCRTYTQEYDYYINTYTVDENGCEFMFVYYVSGPECDDSVWPGDVNFDGIADNEDALWLGIAYDQTGSVRPDASLAWEGQPAPDWNFDFSSIGVNLKHADTDGNGTVNFADTVAISQNYGQTHGKTENGLAGSYPALWVEAVPDTVAPGGGVVATVHLGSATQLVDSLHGIAFTLTFNDMLVDAADFTIDFSSNVLGTVGNDVMTLQKLFLPDGTMDVAVTRNTLQNFWGYGPIATFHIVTTDNLSGIHELRIGVSGVTAITAHGHAVELATVADTVIIDSDFVGIGEAFGADLRIHPNPTSGLVRVNGLQGDVTVEVLDATGRVISRSGNNGSTSLSLDLSGQPEGFYLLRLSGAEGVAVRRVMKYH